MGGGDLNLKKSWHPQTLKNIEKVYLRERKADDEKKKIAQKMKEIEEQRQMKELQELHEASGRIKKKQERLDWIYGGPAAEGELDEDREAYLLGKKRIDKLVEVGKTVDELSSQNIFSSNDALIYGSNANTARDIANKIREDPLLAIKRREQASLQAVINNPVRLKALKEAKSTASGKDKKKKDRKSKKDKKEKKGKRDRQEEQEMERSGKRKHHGGSEEERAGRGSPKRRMRSPPSSSDDSQSDHEESASARRILPDDDRRVEPHRERGYNGGWPRDGRRDDLNSGRAANSDYDYRDDSSQHYREDRRDERSRQDRSYEGRHPERSSDRRNLERVREYETRDRYGSERKIYLRHEETGRDNDRRLDAASANRDSERSWDERTRSAQSINRNQASQNALDSAAPPIKGGMDEAKRLKLEAMLANAKQSEKERQERIAAARKAEMDEAKREAEAQLRKLRERGGLEVGDIDLEGLSTADMIRRNRHTVQRGDDSFTGR